MQPEVWVSTGWQIKKNFLLVALIGLVLDGHPNPKLRLNEVFLTLTATAMTAAVAVEF